MHPLPWNAAAAVLLLTAGSARPQTPVAEIPDFGVWAEQRLIGHSLPLFGIEKPLAAPAGPAPAPVKTPTAPYRSAHQKAGAQLRLAGGLSAEYVTRTAADHLDQLAFWPDAENPLYIMACIETARRVIGTLPGGAPKYNPSVQRIDIKTGEAVTLLRGLTGCDPIRTTPWGTLVVAEETPDGGLYEFLDPARTADLTVVDRSTGEIANPDGSLSPLVKKRKALPVLAYEGIGITPQGVVYAGDELRPGTGSPDKDGGALFKFIPAKPHAGGAIKDLDQSPLASGRTYALQVSCLGAGQQSGQGCETGAAAWVEVAAATARADAGEAGATGYHRPEDGHLDPMFRDTARPAAVRFCWANTQDEAAQSFGEVMCAVDSEPLTASVASRTVAVIRFIDGDARMNQPDNLDFQPGTGNLFVSEDHFNGEIFSCLPDGGDRDRKSDGCVCIASVIDPSAEPTGFIFSSDGKSAYVAIQHSDDAGMPLVDDMGTDDLIRITGFRIPGDRLLKRPRASRHPRPQPRTP